MLRRLVVHLIVLALAGFVIVSGASWSPPIAQASNHAAAAHDTTKVHPHKHPRPTPSPTPCPSGSVPIIGPGADSPCQRIVPQF